MQSSTRRRTLIQGLWVAVAAIGLALLVLSYVVFEPIVGGQTTVAGTAAAQQELPPYDISAWHAFPVQEGGRIKPFETACEETVRHIVGKSRFENHDSVAIVLDWMLRGPETNRDSSISWEEYRFILCPDHDLRKLIYLDLAEPDESLTDEQLHGKYVSPDELRRSPTFKKLVAEAEELFDTEGDKASQYLSPAQRKAQEVSGRLAAYDSITQRRQSSGAGPMQRGPRPSPFRFVALDGVPTGAWFSLSELAQCWQEYEKSLPQTASAAAAVGASMAELCPVSCASLLVSIPDPPSWHQEMQERLSRTPQLYLSPQRQRFLEGFQQQLKAGMGERALDELSDILIQRNDERIKNFVHRNRQSATTARDGLAYDAVFAGLGAGEQHAIIVWLQQQDSDRISVSRLASRLRSVLANHDRDVIENLRARLPRWGLQYHPDDPRFRMLHLDYLETRFPDLYPESSAWQRFAAEKVLSILAAYRRVKTAYTSDDSLEFARASQEFFDDVRRASNEVTAYPGTDTISSRLAALFSGTSLGAPGPQLLSLEMRFNQVMPFRWSWISMLMALLLFGISFAVRSRLPYTLGLLAFAVSLAFQLFGFGCRVLLSGRPPVSNMYETVVWVAFMSSVFALVLELIYRRRVIILAGSLVATLGLVLADQLPLVLDPKISPLVAVLRSNYWLTIHVLTIVSSYAGGTLAWGLGNLTLAFLAFGQPDRDMLKTLSRYTYRAIQIAVLLLAAGTFLGGWWAAESWGRFWGWDPKEVWALIALVCYVIPLHARYIGWVKDFGLAVSAVLCYAAIVMSWYGVNFVLGAGLHSYGFGGGGPWWVFWAGLLNIEWVLLASILYQRKLDVRNTSLRKADTKSLIEELTNA